MGIYKKEYSQRYQDFLRNKDPLYGNKDQIRIQFVKWIEVDKSKFSKMPRSYVRKIRDRAKCFSPFNFYCEEICSKEQIAKTAIQLDGAGRYMLKVRNKYHVNKKFDPSFVCYYQQGRRCRYFEWGWCKTRFKSHKKGWSCKANLRRAINWEAYAHFKVWTIEKNGEQIVQYKFLNDYFKMSRFWFWQNSEYTQKVESHKFKRDNWDEGKDINPDYITQLTKTGGYTDEGFSDEAEEDDEGDDFLMRELKKDKVSKNE